MSPAFIIPISAIFCRHVTNREVVGQKTAPVRRSQRIVLDFDRTDSRLGRSQIFSLTPE
jgi:hypothetical protein